MTFTLIARNPYTGQVGVAMASGSDDCIGGSLAMQDGVGIVSVQARGDKEAGAVALQRMAAGMHTQDILSLMREEDSALDLRQILLMPFNGDSAGFTGSMCIEQAGHVVKPHYVIAGNMLTSHDTLVAMEKAYLSDMYAHMNRRLLAALRAGLATGGDVRGHRSAGIIVLGHQPFDMRITDSQQPLQDLAAAFS